MTYEAHGNKVSEYLSENVIYEALRKSMCELNYTNFGILCHYPLSRLIADWSLLNDKEKAFAESPFSHVDFLLYNTITKKPLMAIEVDGWKYHAESKVQQSRDLLKDEILIKYNLKPYRISTIETINQESLKNILIVAIAYKSN